MNAVLQPWQLLVLALAGRFNRRRQEVIDYLRTEDRILKKAQAKERIHGTEGQRQRLGRQGKVPRAKAARGSRRHPEA